MVSGAFYYNSELLLSHDSSAEGQLEALNENIEKLIEQVRLANSYRFGKHTETLDSIDGQLSFFDEAECFCDLQVSEPTPEEVLPVKQRKKENERWI